MDQSLDLPTLRLDAPATGSQCTVTSLSLRESRALGPGEGEVVQDFDVRVQSTRAAPSPLESSRPSRGESEEVRSNSMWTYLGKATQAKPQSGDSHVSIGHTAPRPGLLQALFQRVQIQINICTRAQWTNVQTPRLLLPWLR